MDQIDNVDNQQTNRGSEETVDGFSDTTEQQNSENLPDAPDPGTHSRLQPMSPEERARAEEEIREEEREGHQGNAER